MTATDLRPVPAFASVLSHVPDAEDRAFLVSAMRMEVGRRSRAAATYWDALEVWCPSCRRSLPASAYTRAATRPNGLDGVCRSCRSSRRTASRATARASASAPA